MTTTLNRGKATGKTIRYCQHGVPISEPGRTCIHGCR
jgi:hypothetical protein